MTSVSVWAKDSAGIFHWRASGAQTTACGKRLATALALKSTLPDGAIVCDVCAVRGKKSYTKAERKRAAAVKRLQDIREGKLPPRQNVSKKYVRELNAEIDRLKRQGIKDEFAEAQAIDLLNSRGTQSTSVKAWGGGLPSLGRKRK